MQLRCFLLCLCAYALPLGDWYPGRAFQPAQFTPQPLPVSALQVSSRRAGAKREPPAPVQKALDLNAAPADPVDKDVLLGSIQDEHLSTDRGLLEQAELVLRRTDQELVGFNRLIDRLRNSGFEKNLVPDSALYEQRPKAELINWYSVAKSQPNDFVEKVIKTALLDLEEAVPPKRGVT